MLGKLLKYDLKWVYKPLIVFYALAIFFALITRGLSSIENSLLFTVLSQICAGVVIAMVINIFINNLMRPWVRFIRNIYKDESYLTHTLPVKKKEIYLSKVLTGFITILTSSVVIVISLLICYYSKANAEMIQVMFEPMADVIGIQPIMMFGIVGVIVLLEFVFMLITGYLGIILGHKSNNKKILKSIIYGFVLFMLMSISTIGLLFISALFNNDIMSLFNTMELPGKDIIMTLVIGGTVLYIVFIALYYFIGKKLLEKGVNVD